MKKIVVVSCLMLMVSCSVWAMQPEVVGGVRGGAAIGIMAEQSIARNVGIRFGAEGNTGTNPLILFCEGKFYLSNVGTSPMSVGVGLVGYSGNNSQIGLAASLIFNNAFNVAPLFMQFGVDFVSQAKLQAQVGYKIY